MNLQELAQEAAAVESAVKTLHETASQALANAQAAKLPHITITWPTQVRGALATALQYAQLHNQSVNAIAAAPAAPKPVE